MAGRRRDDLTALVCTAFAELPTSVIAAGWDETKHPRHPGGTSEGGEFVRRIGGWGSLEDVKSANPDVHLDMRESDKGIRLYSIASRAQGKGLASKALGDLASYADAVGKDIYLTPERIGEEGLATPQLKAWYRRHGYETSHKQMGDYAFSESMVRRARVGVTAAALDYDGPGGMVALYPLEDEAKAIARENGEPWDDLHLTLFFFEDAADLPDELTVDGMGELSGEISGIARFKEGEDGTPIVALPSVVGLNELRAYLASQLDGYSERYGFIPHITLGYDEAKDPEGAIGLPVTFTHVCVASKDNKRFFPLA